MHWNSLADKLAKEKCSTVPEEYLKWSYRFTMIKQHIKQTKPDIIGMSELDLQPKYKDMVQFMNENGY